MKMHASAGALLFALVATLVATLVAPLSEAQVSEAVIKRVYDTATPAMCLVSYSVEVTNPNSGERSRRNQQAVGILVRADGLVLVHGHMEVANAVPFNIQVTVGADGEGHRYDATLLAKPDDVNISLLRLEGAEGVQFPFLRFSRNVRLGIGEPVVVVGMLGESLEHQRSVITRRVGAILAEPRTTYALDESLVFGYIGGPVFDASGNAVGVVGFELALAEGGDIYVRSGHPLIFQTDLFAGYIDNPPTDSNEPKTGEDAWLGIFTQPLSDDLAEYWHLPQNGGVVVSAIVPGSPAAASDLVRGDVLVRMNNTPLTMKESSEVLLFTKLVRDVGAGETLNLRVIRNGETIDVPVVLAPRPRSAREAEEHTDETFGLTVFELTSDIRIMLNLADDVQGVIVRRVESGSWAELSGIRPGLVIMNFGGYPIASIEGYKDAVSKIEAARPDEVTVFCRFGPRTGFFRIQPRWPAVAEP